MEQAQLTRPRSQSTRYILDSRRLLATTQAQQLLTELLGSKDCQKTAAAVHATRLCQTALRSKLL